MFLSQEEWKVLDHDFLFTRSHLKYEMLAVCRGRLGLDDLWQERVPSLPITSDLKNADFGVEEGIKAVVIALL